MFSPTLSIPALGCLFDTTELNFRLKSDQNDQFYLFDINKGFVELKCCRMATFRQMHATANAREHCRLAVAPEGERRASVPA